MNFQMTIEEIKTLIGDMTLENFALKRDNIRLIEQMQSLQANVVNHGNLQVKMPERQLGLVPDLIKEIETEKDSHG